MVPRSRKLSACRNLGAGAALSTDTSGARSSAARPQVRLPMQLPYHRMKRHAFPTSPIAQSRNETVSSTAAEPPASFDDWLDGRLRTLYQTVVNEPLPDEILDLLNEVD